MDVARVNLGVARGAAVEGKMLAKVTAAGPDRDDDGAAKAVESLVLWKDSRTPIEGVHA